MKLETLRSKVSAVLQDIVSIQFKGGMTTGEACERFGYYKCVTPINDKTFNVCGEYDFHVNPHYIDVIGHGRYTLNTKDILDAYMDDLIEEVCEYMLEHGLEGHYLLTRINTVGEIK